MSELVREFLSDWWRSRDWVIFRWGLFSMVGGIGLVVMLLFAELQSSWDRSGQYLGAARHAFAKGDLEGAAVFYEKALKDRPEDAPALFEWMMVSDELGERSSRDATLSRLVEELGHPPALLYAGQVALREGRADESKAILEASLVRIPSEERGPGTALAMRADSIRRGLLRVRWRDGDFREAIDEGTRLIEPVFRDEMDLAVLSLQAGDLDVARQKATALRDRLGDGVGQPEAGLFSALVESVIGNGEAARSRLDQVARHGATERGLLEARVRCFELLMVSMDSLPDLRLLEPAVAGGSPAVVGLVVGLVSAESLTDESLLQAAAGGEVPILSHLVIGLRALRAEREAEATMHLEIVNELAATGGPLLAWCGVRLAHLGHDREALFLADLATILEPSSDGLLRKGQILAALGRWEAAGRLLEDEKLSAEEKAALDKQIRALRRMN